MNKSTFLANNATVMQLQREILKNTKSHYMKISNIVNQNGDLKGHQKSVHEGVKYIFKHCSYEATMIRNECMKESNFLVHITNMKQLQMDHL